MEERENTQVVEGNERIGTIPLIFTPPSLFMESCRLFL
jgi:hypothetical protein